ncbi:MAG: nicotinate-nucleotide--dimethylbenzimidazole phosphoribosyltransferase [Jiangellaceae bacterium]
MSLDLPGRAARVPKLDDDARNLARSLLAEQMSPPGSLGRLGEHAGWLAAAQGRCPTARLVRVRLVVVAADHGVADASVSAYSASVTAERVRALVAGGGIVSTLAELEQVGVHVVDVGLDVADRQLPAAVDRRAVRRGSGRVDVEDALTRAEVEAAFESGVAVADAEVDAGTDLLVAAAVGVAASTPAATLAALLTSKHVASVVGRDSGIDDRTWMRKCAAVRDAARRGRRVLRDGGDMLDLLATVGGADLAALTGLLLQSAVRRTPVVVDGLVTCAAAAVAQRISRRSTAWLVAGHRSPDPGQAALLQRLRLDPVVDHAIGADDGTGALLAVAHLRAAAALLGAEPSPASPPGDHEA